MIQTVLSSILVILAVAYSFYILGKGHRSFPSLALVCGLATVAALELFDLLAGIYPEDLFLWKKYSMLAEGCMVPSWLLFSLTYARQRDRVSISLAQGIIVLLSCAFPLSALVLSSRSFFYSPDFSGEHVLFLDNPGYFFYTGLIIFMVVTLINLEATLAHASHGSRWKIKYEILGTVSLLGVLIFYYSQGLLYRTINMNLSPLRSLVMIAALALMAYSRFMRGDGVKIHVSKQMAFRSVVLLVVGLYLAVIGLIGEGMKYFGESFQRSMAMALAFLAGIGMLIVLLSETVKRKIRLFLHRNFYRHKYDYRAQWLQFTDRLSSSKSGDDLLKSIVSGFTEVFGMGCGALFLLDDDRRVYYSAASLDMENADKLFEAGDPLITTLAIRQSPVNLCEDEPEFAGRKGRFFAGNAVSFIIPLTLNSSTEGFIVLGRPVNKREIYSYEDYDLMNTLARQATSAVLNLRLSDELSRAREMEAMGRLSAFVLHDLKNLVTTLALVVDNSRQFIDNPEFQADMLESLDNTVAKMKALILRLKKLQDKGSLHRETADLLKLTQRTAGLITGGEVRVSGESAFAEIDSDEIEKLLLNLIVNSIEASGGKKPVMVEVGNADMIYIKVADEGCGMSEDFLKRDLFRPFRTTKKKGLGIGLYQCRQIAEAHGGKIEAESEFGKGAVFTLWLPKIAAGDHGPAIH